MKIIMTILVAFAAVQDGSLAPDVWVHEGDSDGDGLSDAFELAHGLDPHKVSSFADGIADESRLDSSGKTMWEVQQAEGGSHGGGACGLIGLEGLLLLAIGSGRFRASRGTGR